MRKDFKDKVGLRGKLEIFRYNADKTKLLYPPYIDENVIVNTGRQAIRGLFADTTKWSNAPSVNALWGDLQPVAVSELYVDKMKLGASSMAASPIDEELLAPVGGTGAVESAFTGDGVKGVAGTPFVPAFFNLAVPPMPRTVVMTTWVDVPGPISSTYIYGVDDGNGTITGQKDFYNGAAWITVSMTADVNYVTGRVDAVVYSHPPTNGVNVDCMYQTAVSVVPPDHGGGAVYNHTFVTVPISHNTLHIVASTGTSGVAVTGDIDDIGGGVLTGNITVAAVPITVTGTVNYTTGVMVLNFSAAVAVGVRFTCTYQVDWSSAVDVYFPNPYSIRFEVTLGVGDLIGYTFAEEGIFTDDTFDLMIARKSFTPFTKGAAEVVVFRHTLLL